MRMAAGRLCLLVCTLLGGLGAANPSPRSWRNIPNEMQQKRSQHTTTVLPDGRLLAAGGFVHSLSSTGKRQANGTNTAELYDPDTGQWTATGSMTSVRSSHTATLLPNGKVLVVGGFSHNETLKTAELYDPSSGTWKATAPPQFIRAAHTATLLSSGKVLVLGGMRGVLDDAPIEAELYDPENDTWRPAGRLSGKRAFHTATLLPGDEVLVVGGMRLGNRGPGYIPFKAAPIEGNEPVEVGHVQFLNSVEVFDLSGGRGVELPGLLQARAAHCATLMPDGRVLVTGGWNVAPSATEVILSLATMSAEGVEPLGSTELFDPADNSSLPRKQMKSGRAFHTATLLPSGKLLVVGGIQTSQSLSTTELYNPASDEWLDGGLLPSPRSLHTATLLPGGVVFLAGGYGAYLRAPAISAVSRPEPGSSALADSLPEPLSEGTATLLPGHGVVVVGGDPRISTTVYGFDGSLKPFAAGPLAQARFDHTATLMPSGELLVVGGYDGLATSSVESFDPEKKEWTPAPRLKLARTGHTATLLRNGKLLVVGGVGDEGAIGTSELYDPQTQQWSLLSFPDNREHHGHTATLLSDGRVLVAGSDWSFTERHVDLYDPAINQWQPVPSMLFSRAFHTATLLPDKTVLVTGGLGDGIPALESAEIFDPSTRTWRKTSSMSVARKHHTATLLPTGRVLVAGGYGVDDQPLDSAEEYDFVTGEWSALAALAMPRAAHSTALLPDGSLLLVGGERLERIPTASAEIYRPTGASNPAALAITSVTPTALEPGGTLTVTGTGLWIGLNAGGGATNSSADSPPLLTLRAVQGDRWQPLTWSRYRREDGKEILTTVLPALPSGHYVLNVHSRGLTAGHGIVLRNTTPPRASLGSPPAELTREMTASFEVSCDAEDLLPEGQSFECALDEGEFGPCTFFEGEPRYREGALRGTVSVDRLSEGRHTFRVRARDFAGNVQEGAAEYSWVVDTQAPVTTFSLAPASKTGDTMASFTFSTDAGDLDFFECSLDGEEFQLCDSSVLLTDLGIGSHTFQVRARDKAGNLEANPAQHTWTVQTGYYGMSCAAGGGAASAWMGWAGSLMLLGLLKRRRN